MSEPFLGEIMMFGGNFAPRGWAQCDGEILPINQNQSLYSILGTTYGGDGRTSFALPDLRGRLAMHAGDGPGLQPKSLGQKGGSETVTLETAQLASHTHAHKATSDGPDVDTPEGANTATLPANAFKANPSTIDITMQTGSITNVGDGRSHENRQPFQCVNFIIALQGLFPSRS